MSKLYLDFDEVACAHLLLQMNYIQTLFEFQIVGPDFIHSVSIPRKDDFIHSVSIPRKDDDYIVNWFDTIVINLENYSDIDYWIGITSESIGGDFFARIPEKGETRSRKILSVITSKNWEREYSPPSLFEYIALTTFICSLCLLSLDFRGEKCSMLHKHTTRGCIFDYTHDKPYRRILVSNPNLCSESKENMQQLETVIQNTTGVCISLCESIGKVLSRKWLGSLKKEGSPIYNLRRNYGYNVDVNSGFYKRWLESVRDNIKENGFIWLITGIIGVIFLLFQNFILSLFHLQAR